MTLTNSKQQAAHKKRWKRWNPANLTYALIELPSVLICSCVCPPLVFGVHADFGLEEWGSFLELSLESIFIFWLLLGVCLCGSCAKFNNFYIQIVSQVLYNDNICRKKIFPPEYHNQFKSTLWLFITMVKNYQNSSVWFPNPALIWFLSRLIPICVDFSVLTHRVLASEGPAMDIISCRMVSTPATQHILATENHTQFLVQYFGNAWWTNKNSPIEPKNKGHAIKWFHNFQKQSVMGFPNRCCAMHGNFNLKWFLSSSSKGRGGLKRNFLIFSTNRSQWGFKWLLSSIMGGIR